MSINKNINHIDRLMIIDKIDKLFLLCADMMLQATSEVVDNLYDVAKKS